MNADSNRLRLGRVRRWHGAVTWYVEGERLLAADQRGFVMRYQRIPLGEITSVVLWPVRTHLLRAIAWFAPAALVAWVTWLLEAHLAASMILVLGVLAAAAELGLGPRSQARIEFPQGSLMLPLVARWRGAAAMQARLESILSVQAAMTSVARTP